MTASPPTDPTDLWTLSQSNKYSVDKVYTRSTDNKGHATNVQCPIQPSLHHEIAALVQSGAIREYRTIQDFIRDAVLHRAKYMGDMVRNGTLLKAIDAEIMLIDVNRAKHQRVANQQVITQYAEELSEQDRAGDTEAIQELVTSMREYENLMPEPYSSKLKELADKYDTSKKKKG